MGKPDPTEEQSAVIAFLASPAAHDGQQVRRIDTHSAMVFAAGDHAWKLKRAVRYDYLDFSTVERRRLACEAEVRLNQRAAPGIYRGVLPVLRRADGTLAVGGAGTPVDWLVDMHRFDDDLLFDRLAARHELDVALMRPLAAAIARFHAGARHRPDHGGASGMRWVVDGNADGLASFGASLLDPAACESVTEAARREIQRHTALLERRRAAGLVRQCHGDLHLRNIVLLDGHPTLFDGIEFNDAIACTDVLYDLAFLLMDLWRRHLPTHANTVWNGYLAETGDLSGIELLPLFLSCRAAVRAKTSATAAGLQDELRARADLERAARDYLALAGEFLHPAPPALVAIGGFSGSGKSTLAYALAPTLGAAPGAVVLRSDELRKQLCGVAPLVRLGPEGYTPEVSRRVYAQLAAHAETVVRAGASVIADAVYARPEDRSAIEQAAMAVGVPFTGLWLDAPEAVLAARLRERAGDVSDADADVLHQQSARGAGAIAWHRLNASMETGALTAQVAELAAVCPVAPRAAGLRGARD